jgi:hypothetical protein
MPVGSMTKPDLPLLTGTFVKLRPPRPDDTAMRLRLGSDAEIIRMYGGSHADVRSMTVEGAARWVQRLMDQDYAWIIEAAGELIGHIRLDRVDLTDRRASLAVGIDDPTQLWHSGHQACARIRVQFVKAASPFGARCFLQSPRDPRL